MLSNDCAALICAASLAPFGASDDDMLVTCGSSADELLLVAAFFTHALAAMGIQPPSIVNEKESLPAYLDLSQNGYGIHETN